MTLSPRSGVLLGVALAAVLVEPRVVVRPRSAISAVSLIDSGRYQEAEQAAGIRLAEVQRQYGERSYEMVEASNLWLRARLLNGRGGSEESIATAEAQVRLVEETFGGEDSRLVPALRTLGEVLVEAARAARAIEVYRRALTLDESAGDSLELTSVLDDLGTALTVDGQHDEALVVLERSLRIKERLLDDSDRGIARTLEATALASQRKGAYGAARLAIERAAAIQEAVDPNHPDYVGTLNLLAQQFWFDNDLSRSRESSVRAVELAESTLRPDHPMLAKSLRYLAGTVFELGDLQRAHRLWTRAFDIAVRNFGAGHLETALYLHDVALSELELGQYVAARANFEEARRVFENALGSWHDHVAHTLHNAAIVDARLGDLAQARRKQARAIAIWTRTSGATHPYVAEALTELARVLLEQGSSAEAQRLLERALTIRQEGFGPDHRDVALTLAELANVLMRSGQQARAQELATRALGIWERIASPDAPEQAAVMALYAELQASRAQYEVARTYYERSSAIQRKVFGPSSPSYAASQVGLANVLAAQGEYGRALSTAVDAETTGRDHLRLMMRSLPERQALAYATSRPRALDLVLSLTMRPGDAVASAFAGTIRGRALILDEMAARRRALLAPGNGPDPVRVDFDSAQQRLANLVVRGPGNLSSATYAAILDEARQESERAEQALAERSIVFRSERSRAQLGLDEVAAALPQDGVLLSFVRYNRTLPPASALAGESRMQSSQTVPSYLAFVLRTGRPPIAVPLGSASRIDAAVSQWRAHVARALPTRASGAALRQLVWEPIASHLSGAQRLFVVPDGSLSLVTFDALPVGEDAWLIEEAPVIHYLTAERDLVPEERTRPSGTRSLLAVGGAAFDGSTHAPTGTTAANAPMASTTPVTLRGTRIPCADLQSVRFQPLTGTLREVQELSSLWSNSTPSTVGRSQTLTGQDATETRLKLEAPRHRVLHLATHGFFLGGDCVTQGEIETRGVGGLTTGPASRSPNNPLLLSGLALAGANRRAAAAPDEDDGILTAEEVASLDLSGVEWAVLSACDTGVGEIKAGEGVFGLRRAFQVAGARTVIMSLWSVEDQATRAWMRALYEARFQKRLSTADAVHAASLAVLRERRAKGQSTHPFFWAAFVAAGDWR
jgi:CHAT domain-containing protein/Tfp pilus assembly protein PilF